MTLNKVIDDKSFIDRIKTLESIQDIIKLKSVYCRYCDADYDPKKLANLFCEDGILNLGKKFGIYKGKNEIIISQTAEILENLASNKKEIKEFSQKIKDDLTIDLLAQFSEALRKKYKITINDDVIDQLN